MQYENMMALMTYCSTDVVGEEGKSLDGEELQIGLLIGI